MRKGAKKGIDYSSIDKGIKEAVRILNENGFITFESCEGGTGHTYSEPTVRFWGNEFDCIRALEICEAYNLCVLEVKRVFRKVDQYLKEKGKLLSIGMVWDKPFNEIIFMRHSETGTIFLPD